MGKVLTMENKGSSMRGKERKKVIYKMDFCL